MKFQPLIISDDFTLPEGSKGFNRLKNYFSQLSKTKKFNERIDQIKNKYSIPDSGFKKDTRFWFDCIASAEWKSHKDNKKIERLKNDIRTLCQEYALCGESWVAVIWEFIFYNQINTNAHSLLYEYDLCKISDNLLGEKKLKSKNNPEYPIAITISPYANSKDIHDFITKNYNQISKLQKKYKSQNIKINQLRVGKLNKVKEYIYNNQNLSRQKIADNIKAEFNISFTYKEISDLLYEIKHKI